MNDDLGSYVVVSRVSETTVNAWSPELKHEVKELRVNPEYTVELGDYIIASSISGLYEKVDASDDNPPTGTKSSKGIDYLTFQTSITALPADFFDKNVQELKELAASGAVALSFDLGFVYATKKFDGMIHVGKIYKATVVDHRLLLDNSEPKTQKRLSKQLAKVGTIWSVTGELTELDDVHDIERYEKLINSAELYDYKFKFTKPIAVLSSTNSALSLEENSPEDRDQKYSETQNPRNVAKPSDVATENLRDIQDTIDQFCASFDDLPDEQYNRVTLQLYKILSNAKVFRALKEIVNPEELDHFYNSLHQKHGF